MRISEPPIPFGSFSSGTKNSQPFSGLGPFDYVSTRQAWASGTVDASEAVPWSVVDIDMGGYGKPALFVTYGALPDVPSRPQPDRLLVNEGTTDAPSYHLAPELLLDHPNASTRGVALTDLDANGVPDLVAAAVGGPPSILLRACNDARRLRVSLQQVGRPNTRAIGARVRVEVDGLVQEQTIRAGGRGSFSSVRPSCSSAWEMPSGPSGSASRGQTARKRSSRSSAATAT